MGNKKKDSELLSSQNLESKDEIGAESALEEREKPDLTCEIGTLIRLDGRPLIRLEDLQGIRWRISKQPKGSKASLDKPLSLTASLRPDVPGLYEIQAAPDVGDDVKTIRILVQEQQISHLLRLSYGIIWLGMTVLWVELLLLTTREAENWQEIAFWIYTVLGFVPWVYVGSLAFPSPKTLVLPPDRKTIGGPQTLRLLKTSIPQRFMNVSPYEFEEVICQMFKDAGFSAELTPRSSDFGADIILKKIGIDERIAVQVKRYAPDHKVGVKEISQAVAGREHYQCDKSMVITTSSFTSQAIQLARSTQTVLWDWAKLYQAIQTLYLEGQESQTEAEADQDEEAIQRQTAPVEEVAMTVSEGDWQVVKSWVGQGRKTTESFHIKGDEWRITWEIKGHIDIEIWRKGEDYKTDEIVYDGEGSDTSYVHGGPGQYFLKVWGYDEWGSARWKVTVEERC